ncbi:MAG: N-6 DNA methylase [Chlamydiales bacterium]|nr:N-6 DNA methylase [Chlamydiales bacterium]
MQDLFITTTPFLQPLLLKELQEMGVPSIRQGLAGLFIPREMEWVYKINYCSRFATRVLWPFLQFRCEDREDLYRGAYDIDWPGIFSADQTFAIDANVTSPTIRHSLFAAQVVKDAICDRFRKARLDRPSVKTDDPDVQFNLFIYNGIATLSLDTSGAPLFKRGWRTQTGDAPLPESVAAAVLSLSNFSSDEILCDPFCGSGTILIEAAFHLTQTPSGFFRKSWGFFNHPNFSESEWQKVKAEADHHRTPLPSGKLFGADKDPMAINMCAHNLKNANFEYEIEVTPKDIRSYFPETPPTLILSNPPYGKRLQTSMELYQALGHFMKTRCAKGCRASILCPDENLMKNSGLTIVRKQPVSYGGISLFLFHLTAE